jgi:hypothetical protein
LILYFFNILQYSYSKSEYTNCFNNYLSFLSIFNHFVVLFFLILRGLFLNFVNYWLFSLGNTSNSHKLVIIKLDDIFVQISLLRRFLCNLYIFLLNFNILFGIITVINSQSWLFNLFTNNFSLLLYLLKQKLWFLFFATWIFYFHFFFFIFLFIFFLRFLLLYFIILLGNNHFHLFYLYLFYLFFEGLIVQFFLFLTFIFSFVFLSSSF